MVYILILIIALAHGVFKLHSLIKKASSKKKRIPQSGPTTTKATEIFKVFNLSGFLACWLCFSVLCAACDGFRVAGSGTCADTYMYIRNICIYKCISLYII